MDHSEILTILINEVARAREHLRLANESFQTVMKDIPSSLPHPDGVQRIHNVSAENAQARKNLETARIRLDQFQAHGYIPLDLRGPRKDPQPETNQPLKAKSKGNASG
jgi:hypothetical protein